MPCVIVACMFVALLCLAVVYLVWAGLAFGVAICLRLAGFSLGLAGVLLLWSFAFCVVQIDFLVHCRGTAKSGHFGDLPQTSSLRDLKVGVKLSRFAVVGQFEKLAH
jgi:hypothetical protein